MDYSELVNAIRKGDDQKANQLCSEAIPILKKYLISNVDASPVDAEDAVQKMFEYLIPKIQKNEINSPTGLLSYMLTGARHSYYKIVRDFDLDRYDEMEEELAAGPEQVWKLMDDDQQSILKRCIQKLKNHYRDLVTFIFEYPEAESSDIAEYFNISQNNAYTRKHRVIQKLHECVEKHI